MSKKVERVREEVENLLEREAIPDGYYAVQLGAGTAKIDKKGNRTVSVLCHLVGDPNDPQESRLDLAFFNRIMLPLINKNVPGHKRPQWGSQTLALIHAVFPEEVPMNPRREADGSYSFKKRPLADDDYDDAMDEMNIAFKTKLEEIEANPLLLKGRVFFAEVKTSEDGWTNLKSPTPEPIEGITYVTSLGETQVEGREAPVARKRKQ